MSSGGRSGARPAPVTGAARRIALAITRRLAADGCRVGRLNVDGAGVEAAAGRVGGAAVASR